VRRRAASAAVAVMCAGLVLAGCSSNGSSASSSSSGGGTPTVTGSFGATPTVKLPGGTAPTTLVTKVLVTGTGPVIAKGQTVVANYVGELWKNGKVFDSSFSRHQPVAFQIGTGQVIPGWDKSVVGKTVGSRLLMVIPPADGYGSQGQSQAGISGTDTLVFVVDLIRTFGANASASGRPAAALPSNLPKVSTGQGRPTVTIPKVAPPTKLVAVPVVIGSGPAIKKGQQVVVQYVGMIWRDSKVFDASWTRGQPAAFGIGVGQVIKGWDTGLVGKTVGSRVLLVLPPAEGYGSAGQTQAGIKGTDTLVFAVDILAAIG
jgi:peptidylprolyl isomerase